MKKVILFANIVSRIPLAKIPPLQKTKIDDRRAKIAILLTHSQLYVIITNNQKY